MDFDLKVVSEAKLKPIQEIVKNIGVLDSEFIPYGTDMGKLDLSLFDRLKDKKEGKLILVSAITPTPAGEGKTTMSIALSDGLNRIGKSVMTALREPSLGPVLGMKGGATGGGRAQIMPREKINLHFTGDLHAISTAHNFISAAIDNHLYFGNKLDLDTNNIVWPRTMDMNDRALRDIETLYRKDHFIITAASEIMAILALSTDLNDLKRRVSNILIGYNKKGEPIFAESLKVSNAVALLLREAIKPNVVQTLENVPVLVHGGPFANIAHGCNSVIATKMALKLADYTVTEAGFGADLGAEKFLDIKTRAIDKNPDAVVLVATLRALKYHGFEGEDKTNLEALHDGVGNIERHANNVKKFGIPYIIAINHFIDDKQEEIDYLIDWANKEGHPITFVDSFLEGSKGAVDFAEKVVKLADKPNNFVRMYDLEDSLFEKVHKLATNVYGAGKVTYSKSAQEKLEHLNEFYGDLPICIAKTPLSFSNSPKKRGAIFEFDLAISDARVSRGAGFVVVLTKGIITMPGLPQIPNAEKLTINKDGTLNEKL